MVLKHSSSPGVTTRHYGCLTSNGHISCVHSYPDLVSKATFVSKYFTKECLQEASVYQGIFVFIIRKKLKNGGSISGK